MHGVGVARLSRSLARYFETLNAAFEAGAIFVTEAGEVDLDFEAFRDLSRHLNPHCDAFDDSLPSAVETREWREP